MHAQDRSPAFYARLAGTIYLVAMALSMFTQVYVPSQIVVAGDATATARNLSALEGLYRSGIVIDLMIFVSDAVIGWAFYQLLRSVDGALAQLGMLLRVADAAILSAVTLFGLIAVRLVGGADYLAAIDPQWLDAQARLFMSMRGAGLYIGFVFLGAGSTVFAWLMFKSRCIPRALAGWGLFASPMLALGSLATLASPWFASHLSMAAMLPMLFYEVPLGIWLLAKGVRLPVATGGSASGLHGVGLR